MTAWKKHKVSPERIKIWTDYSTIKYRRTNAIHLFRIAYLSRNEQIAALGLVSDTYVINKLIFLNSHGLKEKIYGHHIYLSDSFIPLSRITSVTLV